MKTARTARISAVCAAILLAATAPLALGSCRRAGQARYTVGICQLVRHQALDEATRGFKEELTKELGGDVRFLEENAQGESGNCTAIINSFVTRKVDLILANATGALQAAANGTSTIPVLGTSVTDYGTALGLQDFDGLVGGNVSGTSDLAPLDRQAQMVRELFPDAATVALLYCSSEPNSDYQVRTVRAELERLGLEPRPFAFTDSNDVSAVAAAAASCDVIYVPTDNTAASCASTILGAIGDTPVIAGEEAICAGCGVATLTISYRDLGAATARMAARILKGEEDISRMRVAFADRFTKKYNAARCRELRIDTDRLEAAGYQAIGQ